MTSRLRPLVGVLTLALGVAGLAACDDGGGSGDDGGAAPAVAGDEVVEATFEARGGVTQVIVEGAPAGSRASLVDDDGDSAGEGEIDDEGNLVFRDVEPGAGYTVRVEAPDGVEETAELTVMDLGDVADDSFYADQEIGDGYGYVETRDGTTLAVNVKLPGPAEDGPYPTVVEYSGYDPANPTDPEPGTLIAQQLGYATVGVNMRGTGCSGGAFDLFDAPQITDGYDVIEAVAREDWVLHNHVGMVGISYPGITQLFVASAKPPSLAAITPLSVTDDLYRGTGYPGGIFNDGFAQSWIVEREEQGKPGGQKWAQDRIDGGDEVCAANQSLRSQNRDLLRDVTEENAYYVPDEADARTPYELVDDIDVPVFIAGAWQDEQTGGHWPTLLERLQPGEDVKATLTNGTHFDSFGPEIIGRWIEFLDLFVAERVPLEYADARGLAPVLYGSIIEGSGQVEIEPYRYAGVTDYEEAKAQWLAEPPVRVLFEMGAGTDPGTPMARYEATFEEWPPPAEATTFFLGDGGVLTTSEPDEAGEVSYNPDPSARPRASMPPGSDEAAWATSPPYEWAQMVDGKGASFVSEPLADDTVMVGTGSVDLWITSTEDDADLQVTLTEVRPDGKETYVQSGWLRASHRALDEEASSELRPRHTHLEADAEPLTPGEVTPVRVELFPFGHVFRAGSRVRIIVSAPGGDRPRWTFATPQPDPDAEVTIVWSGDEPSRIVLPVVEGVEITPDYPPCPSLRGQPCRDYVG